MLTEFHCHEKGSNVNKFWLKIPLFKIVNLIKPYLFIG